MSLSPLPWSRGTWPQWSVWLVCLSVVALLEWIGLVEPPQQWLAQRLAPILSKAVSVGQWIEYPGRLLQSHYQTLQRIQDLELAYTAAAVKVVELSGVQAENEALREMLNAATSSATTRSTTAGSRTVLAAPIISLAYPAVGVGQTDGVQPKQMVLVASTLVGVVDTLSSHQAQIRLLTQSPITPVLAQTKSGVQGLIKGDGRRVLLTELPADAQVSVGELVTTLGQEGIAKDVLVGRVSQVISDPRASVQVAVIEQLVSFYQARVVEIRN